MGDKLVQLNDVLRNVFEKLEPDTLAIVMGDHGMDAKGDHGGDSRQELEAALFMYSKKPLVGADTALAEQLIEAQRQAFPADWHSKFLQSPQRTLPQIDIVSSVCLLMGIPIPYGNLGMAIPELFAVDFNGMSALEHVLKVMHANAKQVYSYLEAYSSKRKDASHAFSTARNLFAEAEALVAKASDKQRIKAVAAFALYMRSSLVAARHIWSRFEVVLMVMGSAVLVQAVLVTAVLLLHPGTTHALSLSGLIFAALGALAGTFIPLQRIFYPTEELVILRMFHEVIFFAAQGWIVDFARRAVRLTWKRPLMDYGTGLGALFALLLVSLSGSDSFCIFQDFVVLYFVQTILLVLLAWARTNVARAQLLATMVLVRVISLSTICRPDQGPYCVPTFNGSADSSVASYYAPLGLAAVSVLVVVYNKLANRHPAWFSNVYLPVQLAAIVVYWTIDTLDSHLALPASLQFAKLLVPRLFLAGIVLLAFVPCSRMSSSIAFLCLSMVQKPVGGMALGLGFIVLSIVQHVNMPGPVRAILHVLVGQLLFFATGHQNVLPTVQYETGFVGLKNVNWIISPLLVALNTFGGLLLASAFSDGFEYTLIRGLDVTVTTLFTGWFMRHSQQWRVWGPKFVFMSGGYIFEQLLNAGRWF